MTLSGKATAAGTARFAERFASRTAPGHFRPGLGLTLSSLGLGSYLGATSDAVDSSYEATVRIALEAGANVLDTAINYRCQRSERAFGRALRAAVADGAVARDEVVVATKGGFVPFDGDVPADPRSWFRETFVEPGIVGPDDVVAGCHVLTPAWIRDQIARSRANLGLETIDLYYLHNPETQLEEVAPEELERRIGTAAVELEAAVARGEIGAWGFATWNGFRSPGELSLERLLAAVVAAAGADHHCRAIQLPLNLAMPEALLRPTQEVGGEVRSALAAARALGLASFASASIVQARLLGRIPAGLAEVEAASDAVRFLAATRSVPELDVALVGTATPAHAREDFGLAASELLDPGIARGLFGGRA